MSTLLAGLGRDTTARVRRAIRPLGLGAQEFRVLEQLQVLGDASQAQLADALGIDRSNLAAMVAGQELAADPRDAEGLEAGAREIAFFPPVTGG
mgnify:CR=1 FL=1